jgi:hypothetical protein
MFSPLYVVGHHLAFALAKHLPAALHLPGVGQPGQGLNDLIGIIFLVAMFIFLSWQV